MNARTAKRLLPPALLICAVSALSQISAAATTRSILVNILDRTGNPVRDLTKDNFHIKLNKQPTTVVSVEYKLAPHRVVVLLDVSASMASDNDTAKWKITRDVVQALLTQTPADVPVAFLTFSDHVQDVFDFRESRGAIARWFSEGPSQHSFPKGRTALLDAVVAGARMLQPNRIGDSIYIITDGGDNSSHASLEQTKSVLREASIRLFGFLLSEPSPMSDREGLTLLGDLAADSGGFVFGVPAKRLVTGMSGWSSRDARYAYNDATSERIRLSTQALNIQLNGFYTIEIAAPEKSGKQMKVSLEVVDKAGQPRKDTTFTYQRVLAEKR